MLEAIVTLPRGAGATCPLQTAPFEKPRRGGATIDCSEAELLAAAKGNWVTYAKPRFLWCPPEWLSGPSPSCLVVSE